MSALFHHYLCGRIAAEWVIYMENTNVKWDAWGIECSFFDADILGKEQALFALGNGYMGVRSAVEEEYPQPPGNTSVFRYTIVSGTFDQNPEPNQSTELPNAVDFFAMDIRLNGEPLNLNTGTYREYRRRLDLNTGLLTRQFIWTSPGGVEARFVFQRFVSLCQRHQAGTKVIITPLTDCTIQVMTGLNGKNRFAVPHFTLHTKYADGPLLQYTEETDQSHLLFTTVSITHVFVAGKELPGRVGEHDECIFHTYTGEVKCGESLQLEKIIALYTSRDRECENMSEAQLQEMARRKSLSWNERGFELLYEDSADCWKKRIWESKDVTIKSGDVFDQMAIRFAVYHLTISAPVHDNRMNIGAKGLTGRTYRNHTFWDTEIYMLPFFVFTDPPAARSLLEYRYLSLPAARDNAKKRGYKGAMFPWQSAWIDYGEASHAKTGLLEHHITADIAYAVEYYYCVTGDILFMEQYGYELLFETASFWASRVTYNQVKNRYEILNVIGPDEYTEECDNNAFTNYMAHWNLQLAVRYCDWLRETHSDLLRQLNKKLDLNRCYPDWVEKMKKLYLPKANSDGIVPQDDTFLSLPYVDLKPYRNGGKDYRKDFPDLDTLSRFQVSKQADVMVLFLLLEDLFSSEVKRKNYYFYESRCFHHSSLSKPSYCILAADVGEMEQAFCMYEQVARQDLGSDPHFSDNGIHIASLGGLWQCVVMGFLGLRLYAEQLRIQPHLPRSWSGIEVELWWRGQKLKISAEQKSLKITRLTWTQPVCFLMNNKMHTAVEREFFISINSEEEDKFETKERRTPPKRV